MSRDGMSQPEGDPFPKDCDGNIKITDAMADLLLLLEGSQWKDNPHFRGKPLDYYLEQTLNAIYLVPEPVLWLVFEELVEQDRLYKPGIVELKRMCIAGMGIRPHLRDLGMDVGPYEEPDLPPPPSPRRDDGR